METQNEVRVQSGDGYACFKAFHDAYQATTRMTLETRGPNSQGRPQYKGRCPCPTHGPDRNPSFSVTFNEQGVTCCCHKGCTRDMVAAAIGLPTNRWSTRLGGSRSSRPKPSGGPRKRKVLNPSLDAAITFLERELGWTRESWHRYERRDGRGVFVLVRYWNAMQQRKEFTTVCLRSEGGWAIGRPKGKRLPLYHLKAVLASDEVWLCEGEKCADRLMEVGLVATTTAFGAKGVASTSLHSLAGKRVIVVIDNDEAGRNYAIDIVRKARRLKPKPEVVVLDLNALSDHAPHGLVLIEGQDIFDWLEPYRDPQTFPDVRERLRAMACEAQWQGRPDWLEAGLNPPLMSIPWGKVKTTLDVGSYLAQKPVGYQPTKGDQAVDAVLAILRTQRVGSVEIHDRLLAAGFSKKIIRTARERLRSEGWIAFVREGGGQVWELTALGLKAAKIRFFATKPGRKRPSKSPR